MEFREGEVGALLDEYERALDELISRFNDLDQDIFTKVINPDKEDRFQSIQTIANHVINAGYSYSNYIREHFGNFEVTQLPNKEILALSNVESELYKMFRYHEEAMGDKHKFSEEFFTNPIKVKWGQVYDLEQIIEHAIVHLLRHRRQIDRFLKN